MLKSPEMGSGYKPEVKEGSALQIDGTWGIGLAVESPDKAYVFRYHPEAGDWSEQFGKCHKSGWVVEITDPTEIKKMRDDIGRIQLNRMADAPTFNKYMEQLRVIEKEKYDEWHRGQSQRSPDKE